MNIYDRSYISKRAAESGFNRDVYEKTLRLTELLEFINIEAFLSDRLALKGGTAINLIEFNLPRLSVDIDLDYTINSDVEQMKKDREDISSKVLKFMEQNGYTRKKSDRKSFALDSYYFTYINTGGNKDNIKVDINYVMRAHIYNIKKRQVKTNYFQVESGINSLDSIEIFGSKINALNNRAAARDLYDVYKLIESKMHNDNKSQLRKAVIFYHVLTSDKISGNFDLKAADKLTQHGILRELVPVLKKGEAFILKEALERVGFFVDELMNMTEDEHKFIINFTKGQYCPELLFDDKEILNNIRNHPMAKWKASKQ